MAIEVYGHGMSWLFVVIYCNLVYATKKQRPGAFESEIKLWLKHASNKTLQEVSAWSCPQQDLRPRSKGRKLAWQGAWHENTMMIMMPRVSLGWIEPRRTNWTSQNLGPTMRSLQQAPPGIHASSNAARNSSRFSLAREMASHGSHCVTFCSVRQTPNRPWVPPTNGKWMKQTVKDQPTIFAQNTTTNPQIHSSTYKTKHPLRNLPGPGEKPANL